MTEKENPQEADPSAPPVSKNTPSEEPETIQTTRSTVEAVLTPRERRLRELAERRREGLSPHDFDTNEIRRLDDERIPLTRTILGNQAVIIDSDALKVLRGTNIILASGVRSPIDPEDFGNDDVLIIYPEDLGNEEGKPL